MVPTAPGILLVDDDYGVRTFMRTVLEGDGYRVWDAEDGERALALFEEHAAGVDLLVTDVVMPDMSGPELARVLASRRPELPVLYVSGYCDDFAKGMGGASCIPKPFRASELLAHVAALAPISGERTLSLS
jgi:two-component system cell cycle sensor histidine kinase/response regulator CckA